MSPTAATCIAEQIGHTDLGEYILNKRNYNALFHTKNVNITTTTLEREFPIFKEKLGDDKPLRFNLIYKDMKINFNKDSSDFHAEYILGI
jgi:hypothetical protein